MGLDDCVEIFLLEYLVYKIITDSYIWRCSFHNRLHIYTDTLFRCWHFKGNWYVLFCTSYQLLILSGTWILFLGWPTFLLWTVMVASIFMIPTSIWTVCALVASMIYFLNLWTIFDKFLILVVIIQSEDLKLE